MVMESSLRPGWRGETAGNTDMLKTFKNNLYFKNVSGHLFMRTPAYVI